MNSLFLESVHISPPPQELGPPRYIVIAGSGNRALCPRPIHPKRMRASSLRTQINEAVRNPKEFERAMDRALLVNLYFLKNGPFRNTLCPSVANPDLCLNGRFCPHAGSLAELYANNIHLNPSNKTKPCKYRDRCKKRTIARLPTPGNSSESWKKPKRDCSASAGIS